MMTEKTMEVLRELATNFGVGFIVKLAGDQITDDECLELGDTIGTKINEQSDKLLGDSGEKLEDLIQHKLGVIFVGINRTLDADDGVK